MYNLRVQPFNTTTSEFESGSYMSVLRFIGTLPDGTKQVEVESPQGGYKYYVLVDDLPKSEASPWYQVLGEGTFKGLGLGGEFKNLPQKIKWAIYALIALAIGWVIKKIK